MIDGTMSANVHNPRHPGWEDLAPLPQDDGPNPVVAIQYTDEYRELMDLFRAVMHANELSERALILTADVVEANPANYTAWQYRRQCLKALGSDLRKELRFSEATAYDNPKNYQIWFHRRAIVELLGDPAAELPFISNVLLEDAKNYHAWSYRQWVLSTYGDEHNLWDGELGSCHSLLLLDHYNNSAWNMRWFVVSRTTATSALQAAGECGQGSTTETSPQPSPQQQSSSSSSPLPPPTPPVPPPTYLRAVSPDAWSDAVVLREVAYCFSWIEKAPGNESPWSYLRGLMRARRPRGKKLAEEEEEVESEAAKSGEGGGWRFAQFPSLKERVLALRDGGENGGTCIPLLGLLLEILQDEAVQASSGEAAAFLWAEVKAVCAQLAALDAVREPYWIYRMGQLDALAASSTN